MQPELMQQYSRPRDGKGSLFFIALLGTGEQHKKSLLTKAFTTTQEAAKEMCHG
ncbi:MAG: hypothetical protein KAW95_01990 [Dehalococcoidia bacterium]|nr:hypothetical protein [Dehalococcoidia bacterium]